jgi:TonB family protein
MRAQSIVALFLIVSAELWLIDAQAADAHALGQTYTVQATDVARRAVIAALIKHPERIHRMSMKCTFQLDRQGRVHSVSVISSTRNRWAEETAQRALEAAKYPPIPKSVIQQSGSDLARFEYKLDLDEPK